VITGWAPACSATEQLKSENYSAAMRTWQQMSVISGHLWFRPGERLTTERTNLTVLRDPIDRVISHYYFVRSQDRTFHASAPERSLELREFVLSELPAVQAALNNFQTRLLAPLGLSPQVVDPTDDELLAAALRAVDLFDLVGIFAELGETMDVLAHLVNAEPSLEIPHERATEHRPALDDIPLPVRTRLGALNQLDRELYAYAARRFKQRRRQLFIANAQFSGRENRPVGVVPQVAPECAEPGDVSTKGVARQSGEEPSRSNAARFGNRRIEIQNVSVRGEVSLGSGSVMVGENVTISVLIAAHVSTEDLTIGLHIRDVTERLVYGTNSHLLGHRLAVNAESETEFTFTFRNALGVGVYRVGIALHTGDSHLVCCYDWFDDCARIVVVGVIGYHFEGAVSLPVALHLLSVRGGPSRVFDADAAARCATIARHNPIVREARGRVRPLAEISSMRSGDVVSLEVEVENLCDTTVECDGLRPFRLCYRWLSATTADIILEEGIRTALGVDLEPGRTHRLWMTVASPPDLSGAVILRLVPVQENVGWFDRIGSFYEDVPVLLHA
jgi:Wzt C-terminal domain/Sulfotransferase family